MEKINVYSDPLLEVGGSRKKIIRAFRSEAMFRRIADHVRGRGMRGNEQKTAVLGILDAVSFSPEVRVYVGGSEVKSGFYIYR